jgi:tRNA G18 (ribose-2'-O)-methylase SpoU
MPVIPVSDPADARLTDYRLGDPDLYRQRKLFIAEGRLVVRRLLLNQSAYRDLADGLAPWLDSLPIFICQADDFLQLTGFNIHRGCLALVERPPADAYDHRFASGKRLVVLENVANADNVGGIFRSAAAFGVDAILLSPTCCDPLYRKAVRTSMAATLRVPFARLEPWPARLQALKADGFTLVAFTSDPAADELEGFARRGRRARLACLFGSEGDGLTSAAQALADVRVRIPIRPDVDSLNLSVAAGIVLSWLTSAADLD